MMLLNLFIGALLAYVALVYGFFAAGILFLILLILNPRIRVTRVPKLPNQRKLLELIAGQKVEKFSDNVIGYYKGNNIHEFIVVKNKATGIAYRHDFIGTIHYNRLGQIVNAPQAGEVFLPTGLVYKDTGVVVN